MPRLGDLPDRASSVLDPTLGYYSNVRRGAPVLKVEKNLFGGYDVRREDGTVERCELKSSGETECWIVQKGRQN